MRELLTGQKQGVQPVTAVPKSQPSDARLNWFRGLKFGLFIHWGPGCLTGQELSWCRQGPRPADVPWQGRVPAAEYDQLWKIFRPHEFDADRWVTTALRAGMRYLVFTAKHHDGFAMFHTQYSDHHIGRTDFGRDIVAEIADACRRHGLGLGLYYSARDWHHPDYLTTRHDRYLDFYHGQLTELLTHYGRIDILWLDSIAGDLERWRPHETLALIRKLQPNIVLNDRLASVVGSLSDVPEELHGDFMTIEDQIGGFRRDRPWETCLRMAGGQWSWKPNARLMSVEEIVAWLVRCVGGDGNLLLNVGPMPDGRIEDRQAARLAQVGDWLSEYGHSLFGTRGGPLPPANWGACTFRRNRVFVHRLDRAARELLLEPFRYPVHRVKSLSGEEIITDAQGESLCLQFPSTDSSSRHSLVEIELECDLDLLA